MPRSRSPHGIQFDSPLQRQWMIRSSNGRIPRKASTVRGADSSSQRATKRHPGGDDLEHGASLSGSRRYRGHPGEPSASRSASVISVAFPAASPSCDHRRRPGRPARPRSPASSRRSPAGRGERRCGTSCTRFPRIAAPAVGRHRRGAAVASSSGSSTTRARPSRRARRSTGIHHARTPCVPEVEDVRGSTSTSTPISGDEHGPRARCPYVGGKWPASIAKRPAA